MSIKNIIMGRTGLGWIPDPPDKRDWTIDILGLCSSDLPYQFSLSRYVCHVLSQGSTNSCVANALAGAIGICEARAGLDDDPVSRLFMYYLSRAYHGAQRKDGGTFIRLCAKAMQRYGVPSEQFWPFSTNPLAVNRAPGWEPRAMAFGRKDGEYYRITDAGTGRVNAIKSAIASGYPVVFGTRIDKEFLSLSGDMVIHKPTGDIVGGHAMVITGYVTTETETKFEILNSWSEKWREGGFAWISEEYIRWIESSDFTIVRGWKNLQNAEAV